MSILTGKQVLVVGEENSQILHLEDTLMAHGVKVHKSTCADTTIEKITELVIDFILVNYAENKSDCKDVLKLLRDTNFDTAIPVFVIVEENDTDIQEVLSHGAADYVTPHEEVQSVIHKIKTIFGQGSDFSASTTIDITPPEASVTSTGIRVYVVEDDPLLRNLLSLRFAKSSFPFEFSNDGQHTLPAIKQFKPDVIILDLMLPGKSGFEVLEEIKSDSVLRNIPVVVFSNRDGQDDRQKAQELGAVGFYVKAMTDLSELVETIESLAK